ncbi:MAG TPA: caspase family protein, partial [Bryobacteraceae bacterium]|nr:caspase family protein [Bryobacteraceae bacterium]
MTQRLLPMAALVAAAILTMVLAPEAAWADKRVALIVGNSGYQTVPQLPNPSRDASAVAKMFRDAGFDSVELVINVGNLDFKRAIRKFENAADQADIAVVFYAGHGLEIGGTNYLIPVDARLASDRDADDEAIPLERLVSSADGARRLRLIMLDACRDNPFVSSMRKERKVANRAVSGGLGRVEPTSTDTLIAYAAKAGSTADDGDGDHSPFTTAVLKNLPVPGLDVRLAFGRVRDEVLKLTGNRQEPFVYGSLGGSNVSLVPAPVVAQPAAETDVKADYELVQKIGSQRAWEVFLNQHPTGFYADLAKAQIEALENPPQPGNNAKTVLAALPPDKTQPSRESASKEAIEWDKVKDATDPATLQRFIKRFPDSPLSINAQQRIDILKKAQQEREEQALAAAAEAQRKAAEAAAQKKREEDERRAREAEAAEKARAAAAEAAAQKKRE